MLGALGLLPLWGVPARAATSVTLTPIASSVPTPIGLDHYEPAGKVVMSVNYPSGEPNNFELVAQDGSRTPFSNLHGFTEEVKIGAVRKGICQGGFGAGDFFTGNGVPGQIARVTANGAVVQNPWVILPGETGLIRGGLFQDRFCAFGGDLIVATADDRTDDGSPLAGAVWRVTSTGLSQLLWRNPSPRPHLEGVTTVPNDPKYGPWAGKILVGAEDDRCVYTVDALGVATCFGLFEQNPDLRVSPEDIDIVPPNENFFGADFVEQRVYGAAASQFTGIVGDIVVAEEVSGHLYHVRWVGPGTTAASFLTEVIADVTWWEHVTFSPAGIDPIPAAQPPCPNGSSITASITRPAAGHLYLNDADVGPSGVPEAVVKGDFVTATATSSNPANTAEVRFYLDGVLQGTDATSTYQATIDTKVPPGLHTLAIEAQQSDAPCVFIASMPLRIGSYGLQAAAKSVFVGTNIPVEPQVHVGGAAAGRPSGSELIRILDQVIPFYATLHSATDQATTQTDANGSLHADADSTITDVSLYGGYIKADVLRARVRADYSSGAPQATTADAGTEIVGLEIGGVPFSYRAPNEAIQIPGIGRLVLEETVIVGTGSRREITVNMIHLFIDTPSQKAEVVVGSAYAGVNFQADALAGPEGDLIHRIDDAGTDSDAGASPATAIAIAPGVYSGALSPEDSSDYYSFASRQGERIVAGMRPSEREVAVQGPIPPGPPALSDTFTYLDSAIRSLSVTGPDPPDFDLYLYDPGGVLRETSATANYLVSLPERVELNADRPYTPPGATGTWTLEVRRRPGSPDGFYSLELSLAPVLLLAQADAAAPGDAPDACAAARPAPQALAVSSFTGVIRDADQRDFYSVQVPAGRFVTVTMKPDEGGDGANFDLYLYAPGCSLVAYSVAGAPPTKAFPEAIVRFPTSSGGSWVVEVRRVNGVANYTVEIAITF